MVRFIILQLLAIALCLIWGIASEYSIESVNVDKSKVQQIYDLIKDFSQYSNWKCTKCDGIQLIGDEKIKPKKLQEIVDKLNKQNDKYNKNIDPNTGNTKLTDIEFQKIKLEYNNVAEEIYKLNSKSIDSTQRSILGRICDQMLDNLLLMEAMACNGGFTETGFENFIYDNNIPLLSKNQKVTLCYIIDKSNKAISNFRLNKLCGGQE